MIFKSLFFILFSLIFTGCISQPTIQNHAITLPSWYIQPIPASTTYLYGVGEGKTVQEAKNSALNDMASQLSVTVNSSLHQYKQSTSFNASTTHYEKKLTQNIHIDVQKINFTNAHVEKSERIDTSFFILLRVNKHELFTSYKNAFELANHRIKTQAKQAKSQSLLEHINALEKLSLPIQKATSQALILNAINNSFNSNTLIQEYQNIQQHLELLKSNLKIKLSTNLTQNLFANELIHLLNASNFKVVSSKQNIDIDLNSTAVYSKALGWHVVKVTTNIAVISQNKTVSNTIINSIGRSFSSKQSALINASKYFKNEVQQQGVQRLIFNP